MTLNSLKTDMKMGSYNGHESTNQDEAVVSIPSSASRRKISSIVLSSVSFQPIYSVSSINFAALLASYVTVSYTLCACSNRKPTLKLGALLCQIVYRFFPGKFASGDDDPVRLSGRSDIEC